jgi:O-antigen biosynthesis protein
MPEGLPQQLSNAVVDATGDSPIVFRRPLYTRVSVIIVGWKAAPYLIDCLRTLAVFTSNQDYEVIVSLNEPTDELVAALDDAVKGASVLQSRVNLGYAEACNRGAIHAKGEFLVLLNDDTWVETGWLDALLGLAEEQPVAGAIGSRLLDPSGSLTEAGSILWADGTTAAVNNDVPPAGYDWDWPRRVDYCSAAALMVRTALWRQLGGLDTGYFPAYYEDVVLCLELRRLGHEVWYQPGARVRHIRNASSTGEYARFVSARNRGRFVERWADVLTHRLPQSNGDPAAREEAVWHAMGRPLRVLLIDDRLPDPSLGSDTARMADTLFELTKVCGAFVSFFPSASGQHMRWQLSAMGVRVISGDLTAHLASPGVNYDIVVVSKPENFENLLPAIRSHQPQATIIYAAEVLDSRHDHENAAQVFSNADLVVCLSQQDAETVSAWPGSCPVEVIGPNLASTALTVRSFADRADLVMVGGWGDGSDSPDADGLRWFVSEVLPRVTERIPWARLRVTGANPPASVQALSGPSVQIEARLSDAADLYSSVRVAVVPVRFGAGVKLQTIEAIQCGVPTVSTTVGAEGIETFDTQAIITTDDPIQFADRVVDLLSDKHLWETQRQHIVALLNRWTTAPGQPSWSRILERAMRHPSNTAETMPDSCSKSGSIEMSGRSSVRDGHPSSGQCTGEGEGASSNQDTVSYNATGKYEELEMALDRAAELDVRLRERLDENLVLESEVRSLHGELLVQREYVASLEQGLGTERKAATDLRENVERKAAEYMALKGSRERLIHQLEATSYEFLGAYDELDATRAELESLSAEVQALRSRRAVAATDRLGAFATRHAFLARLSRSMFPRNSPPRSDIRES